jgi:hypothetical protein
MKEFFNVIIFKYKRITIRRREISIVVIIMILLLFGLKSCTSNSERRQRLDMLENECTFSKDNVNRLYDLLERSDLCSDDWFSDYDDYITRISEENELLVDIESKNHQRLYEIQVKLLEAMKDFRSEQSEENITELQEVVSDYDALYRNICKGEIGQ